MQRGSTAYYSSISRGVTRRSRSGQSLRGTTDSTRRDVAEAVAAVKRDLIAGLPKMQRAYRTDVSNLAVTVNELTPVSEPLYAVA